MTFINDHVKGLDCVKCGRSFRQDEAAYTCPVCGSEGILDVVYDYERIGKTWDREALKVSREYSLWRYKPLLPVDPEPAAPPLRAGWSPLYHPLKVGQEMGCELWIKDDGINPTASLKDRASAIAVARARSQGATAVIAASTGNAASSLAGAAAATGLRAIIAVPDRAPKAKIAQLLIFGARVFVVRGSYDTAFDLTMQAVERFGFYNRNCAVNPYLVEGKKTVAFEICEQLDWQAPDTVVTSVGDGCIISSLWKGFSDLKALGFIERTPRLIGVQAEGCQPVRELFETGSFVVRDARTIADSIAVGCPRNRLKAVRALKQSGGLVVTVSDEEMLAAMRYLARSCGVFGEPAGITGFAGARKLAAEHGFDRSERVVVLVTGNGLKDIESAMKAAGQPEVIDADFEHLAQRLQSEIR